MKYYYEEKYKKEIETKILDIFEEEDKCLVRLEDSCFYPQGGGQKGDRGYLEIEQQKFKIKNTIKDQEYNSILVMEEKMDKKYIGCKVHAYLDWEFRYKQMRLHTALHVYHALIEDICKVKLENPILSTIEDGYAVNKYDEKAFAIEKLEEVTSKFKEVIASDSKVLTYPSKENENYRFWECLDHIIPCGGVHVDSLSELKNCDVEISHKKKAITVKIILNC